jgi:hypothetical protein
MKTVADKSYRENQNTHFISNNVFLNIVLFMRYVEKYGRDGEATDDNTAHVLFMLTNQGYRQTQNI